MQYAVPMHINIKRISRTLRIINIHKSVEYKHTNIKMITFNLLFALILLLYNSERIRNIMKRQQLILTVEL